MPKYYMTGWSRLHEIVPTRHLHLFLPGRLPQARSDWLMLEEYCKNPDLFPELVRDVLALRNDPADDWKPEKWVCRTCIINLLKQSFFGRLVARLTKGPCNFASSI